MMILRSSPTSPFGRKIKIAAALAGLDGQIRVEVADTTNPDDSMRAQNPLGKIPILIREDGLAIYDSRVIISFLDHLAGGGKLLPVDPEQRLQAHIVESLGDGLMDAAILQRYEIVWREESQRSSKWLEHQQGKIDRALDRLNATPPSWTDLIHVGHVSLACALGYLDFRAGPAWRSQRPSLVAWLDRFAQQVPMYGKTLPHG